MSKDLGLLYEEHQGWLRGWLFRRLGCSSQAADLAQDTFVRLLVAERSSAERSVYRQPRAYLATVGRRLVYDHFRRVSLEQAYLDTLALMPEALAISPEHQLLLLETLLQLDRLLDRLKPVVRTVFLHAQLDGLTYAQIAERLNISERTVRRHMVAAFEACILFEGDW